MRYKQLGRTGVRVSAISLGTAMFGVAPLAEQVDRLIARCCELGINVIDTANTYGNQKRFDRPGVPPAAERMSSEEIIGRALGARRHDFVLCSKVMEPVGRGVNDRGLSRRHIFEQVEKSLRRLKTDYLDIYYAHNPDPHTPAEQSVRAFEDLIRQGKIRYYALSNYSAWQATDVLWKADRLGANPPACLQLPYNLAKRDLELDVVPVCLANGLSMIAFSPLAGGLLAGRACQQRSVVGNQRWGGRAFNPAEMAIAEKLEEIARKAGFSSALLALAWLVSRPSVASAIIGPETVEELDMNAQAVDLELAPDVLEALDRIGAPTVAHWAA